MITRCFMNDNIVTNKKNNQQAKLKLIKITFSGKIKISMKVTLNRRDAQERLFFFGHDLTDTSPQMYGKVHRYTAVADP